MNALTADRARELLEYDPDTGALKCLIQRRRAYAGAAAGGPTNAGYQVARIEGRTYKVHRLAWLLMTGEWPTMEIDHANGDRSDNRWCNLRQATKSQNNANSRIYSNNKSGFKGVSWCSRSQRFCASIRQNYRLKHLGYFDDPRDGHAAYVAAAISMRGEFARAV